MATPTAEPPKKNDVSLGIQLGMLVGMGCGLHPLTRPLTKHCMTLGAVTGHVVTSAIHGQPAALRDVAWTGTTSWFLGEVAQATAPVGQVAKPSWLRYGVGKVREGFDALVNQPASSWLGRLNKTLNLNRPIEWAWRGIEGPRWGPRAWNELANLPAVRETRSALDGAFSAVSKRMDALASAPPSPLVQGARDLATKVGRHTADPLRGARWTAVNMAVRDVISGQAKVLTNNDAAVSVFNAQGDGKSDSLCLHSGSLGLITVCGWNTGAAVRGFWPFDNDHAMPYLRSGTQPNNPAGGTAHTLVDPLRANVGEAAIAAKLGPNWLNTSWVANWRLANVNLNPRFELSSFTGPALVSYFTFLQPNVTSVMNVGPFSYTTRDMAQGIGPGWQWGGLWTFKGAYDYVKRHALIGLNAGWNKPAVDWATAPTLREWLKPAAPLKPAPQLPREDKPGEEPAPPADVSAPPLVAAKESTDSSAQSAARAAVTTAISRRDRDPPTTHAVHKRQDVAAAAPPRKPAPRARVVEPPPYRLTDEDVDKLLVGNDPFFGLEGLGTMPGART